MPYAKETWQETTKELLDSSELNIFIRQDHLEKAKEKFNYSGDNHIAWNIPDLCDMQIEHTFESSEGASERVTITEEIYNEIKNEIDELIKELKTDTKFTS